MPINLDAALKDPAGTVVWSETGFDFPYLRLNDTTKLVDGLWKLELTPPPTGPPRDVPFTISVLVYRVAPQTYLFSETVQASVYSYEDLPVDAAPKVATLDLPAGTESVAARLSWLAANGESACEGPAHANDFDLQAAQGEELAFSAGASFGCEFGFSDAAAGADLGDAATWSFSVLPFAVTSSEFLLEIDYV